MRSPRYCERRLCWLVFLHGVRPSDGTEQPGRFSSCGRLPMQLGTAEILTKDFRAAVCRIFFCRRFHCCPGTGLPTMPDDLQWGTVPYLILFLQAKSPLTADQDQGSYSRAESLPRRVLFVARSLLQA